MGTLRDIFALPPSQLNKNRQFGESKISSSKEMLPMLQYDPNHAGQSSFPILYPVGGGGGGGGLTGNESPYILRAGFKMPRQRDDGYNN